MLYSEELLEHYKNPQNFRVMDSPTGKVTLRNPLCGDVITLYVQISNHKVKDATFQGEGCAISTASASIFTEYMKGKSLSELQKIDQRRMIDIIGIEVSPGRIKCLLLPLEAVKRALAKIV